MKKIFTLLVLVTLTFCLSAQTSGGPDAYGYTWKNSKNTTNPPPFNWFDITAIGTQISGLSDDNIVGPFTLTTGFQYYWYNISKFWIGSNGYISFTGDNIASPFPASIPLSSGANNWVAPLLADLIFTGTGNPAKCYTYFGKDTICISFLEVPFWENSSTGYTGSNTFQIILSRLDTSITFNFLSTDKGNLTSLDNIVGIENITGTLGLSNYTDALPPDSICIKFYYPKTVTYKVTDAGLNWNTNSKNGGVFIKNNTSFALKTNMANYGNQNIGSFTARDTVINSSGTVMTTGSKSVFSLPINKDTTLTFSNTFNPTTTGIYRYNTRLSNVTSDMVASNDYLTQEVVVIDSTKKIITLEYSDGTSDGSLGWNGGNGGVGVFIEPPFYPAKILSTQFYIRANASTPVGFYAKIYDDDGANGSPGTLLDSVYVAPASITLNVYTIVSPSNNNIKITSGGVYILWYMGGAGINIGKDLTTPFSRRTYEVLYNSWADYRDVLTEDFMIGLNVEYTYPKADFAADSSADPQISFTDKSSNTPTSWIWDFGDNTSVVTSQNATHTFTSNGTFKVCLTATNSAGKTTACKYQTVSKVPPVADFSIDSSLSPKYTFTDQSSNKATYWAWDFGENGQTSSSKNPVYTYRLNGNHKVCLLVSNKGGSDSICKVINVQHAAPFADFSADTTNDPKVNFTDKSINSPTSWLWDFGDKTTSSAKSPTHTYTANGTFKVCLKASSAYGSDSICKYVNIWNVPPVANFKVDSLLDPKIRFTDISTNYPTAWYWSFGEKGATSTLKNPSFTYTTHGEHTICLKVTNAGGSDSICKKFTPKNLPPIANFSADASLDPVVSFTDLSTSNPTSWLWDFDDNFLTTNLRNPTHSFTENGVHNVCLIASNGAGKDTFCQKITISNVPPVADFSFNNSQDPQITFTDKSLSNPNQWLWNFDDNGATSTIQSPVYTFTTNGTHKVCLKVSNGGGSDSLCKNILIRKIKPKSDFSYDASLEPEIAFTDLSTNIPTSWYWDFNDNLAFSTLQNPKYTFKKNGNYNVCLIATNAGGSDTNCKTITISKFAPKADFSFVNTSDPLIAFSDLSSNLPTSWHWDFDENGATSSIQNPSYLFKENRNYKVCLKVTNAGGSDSICKTVVVSKVVPTASFTYDGTNMPSISFTDASTGSPTKWTWKFNDKGNDSSKVQSPTYIFKTDGIHHVCLIASNANGNSAPFCLDIAVTGAGIFENEVSKLIKIYPNPFSESTIIEIQSTEIYPELELKCYNTLGKQVESEYSVVGNKIELLKGTMTQGYYFFEIFNKNEKLGRGIIFVQ